MKFGMIYVLISCLASILQYYNLNKMHEFDETYGRNESIEKLH